MKPAKPTTRAASPSAFPRALAARLGSNEHQGARTYGDVSDRQLQSLCGALGLRSEKEAYLDLQRFLFDPWASCPIPSHPPYTSMLADDHSPYEYSVAFGRGGAELRILFEAQAGAPSLHANRHAAERVNERLRERFGLDFRRLDALRDLFLPNEAAPPFSLWHAVSLVAGKAPEFKIYLNPRAHGPENASEVTLEALRRLGFDASATRVLLQRIGSRGDADELRYFSLDLSTAPNARVKVYFAHHDVTVAELERAFANAPTHRAGDADAFCDAIVGQRGPFVDKPVTSCFSFVANRNEPSAATLHVPVAYYLDNDQVASRRIRTYLDSHALDGHTYARALRALSSRPLETAAGLQSYASYRREPTGIRCTVYLSPELFASSDDEYSSTRLKLSNLV